MTQQTFGKDAWVEMFRAVGLNEGTMGQWHHEFETRWPDAHQEFLAWLGVPAADITRIRSSARGAAQHP
jgi:hypothetical protein